MKGVHGFRNANRSLELGRLGFVAVLVAQSVTIMGFTSVMPFIPLYVQELGVEDVGRATAWAGFTNGAAGLTMALTAPLWGRLSDRVGRKLMLLRATVAASVVIGLIGLVSEPWQLLLLRLVQGTLTGTVPAATALVASDSPPSTVGRRLGLLQTTIFVAGAVGPVFGGMFADYGGIRSSFFLTSAMLGVAGIVALLGIPEARQADKTVADREEPMGEAGNEAIRLPYLAMLPGLAGLSLAHVTITSAAVNLPGFLSTLGGTEGRLAGLSGQIVGTSALAAAVGSSLSGRLAGRIGARPAVLSCLLLAGITAVPQAWASGVPELWVLRLVNSAFLGGIIPAANLAIKEVVPPGRQGEAYGVASSATAVGFAVGPAGGGLLAAGFGFSAPFLVPGLALALAAPLTWVVCRRRPKTASRQDSGT